MSRIFAIANIFANIKVFAIANIRMRIRDYSRIITNIREYCEYREYSRIFANSEYSRISRILRIRIFANIANMKIICEILFFIFFMISDEIFLYFVISDTKKWRTPHGGHHREDTKWSKMLISVLKSQI